MQPNEHDPPATPSFSIIVQARLVDLDGTVIARYSDWPQPFRHCEFPDPALSLTVAPERDGERITISVERPVKGLCISVPGDRPEVKWSDNCLDVVPGDPQTIVRKGLPGTREFKLAYMGLENGKLVASQ